MATARKVQRDYTEAFAQACARALLPAAPGGRFRFVFCSGAMAERDPERKLAFMADTRLIKARSPPSPSLRPLLSC